MNFTKTLPIYLCSALIAVAAPTSAPAPEVPPLAAIIAGVVARDDANEKNLQTMEFNELLRTEQLGAKGEVTQHQEVRAVVRPGAKEEVEVLSAKGDDLPTDPDQAVKKAKGENAQRGNVRFALKDMAERFTITYGGLGTCCGAPVYLIHFEPKPDQTYRDQTEKVLNHLHGSMWISTADYSVLKTDATLAEPVDVAWFVAQITELNFRYELDNISGGMGPAHLQTSVVVKAPFLTFRQRMTVDMTQFRPRTAVAKQH